MDIQNMPAHAAAELQHAEEKIERAMRGAYLEVGIELRHIRDNKLYKSGSYSDFDEYAWLRWDMRKSRAYQLIDAADATEKISTIVEILPERESHVRPLLSLKEPEHQAEVWQRVLDEAASNGQRITAKLIEAEVERKQAELDKAWYTLAEWQDLKPDDAERIMSQAHLSKKTFNQTNDNIEWAAWSWNPVTGCLHNCDYCYARDIAQRFYPQDFEPSFLPERLVMPANTKVPAPRFKGDIGYKNVFTCSMADLFGKWVPAEWIEAVLHQVRANPQWNFLFLTKFPIRMAEFAFPDNAWVGTTVDRQYAVERAEKAFRLIDAPVKFLSCEPLLERLQFTSLDMFDWVIIGGSSKSSQTDEFRPPRWWVNDLEQQARDAGCKIYEKTNLLERIKEYPGGA
jgi:protein gp37